MEEQRYDMKDAEFRKSIEEIHKCNKICWQINTTEPFSEKSRQLMEELFNGNLPQNAGFFPPMYIDMGSNMKIGEHVIINQNFTCMARGGITIDDNVMIGPEVTLLTANHDFEDHWVLLCKPIHICENAWIGARAVILPGVTVCENAVVAAGAIVTKDVPANCVVGGNPARILKQL